MSKLEPLPQEFIDLPMGKHSGNKIRTTLGLKSTGDMTKIANGQKPKFQGFWDYLKVTKNAKGRWEWTKIK